MRFSALMVRVGKERENREYWCVMVMAISYSSCISSLISNMMSFFTIVVGAFLTGLIRGEADAGSRALERSVP